MKLKKIIVFATLCAQILTLQAQEEPGDYYVPLFYNHQISVQSKSADLKPLYMGKTGVKDTLELPFFDDFSKISVIPNDSLWVDAAVFINADFAINPPSIGVATFDALDSRGNAYGDISPGQFGPADTLTSQPINLSAFNPADSIYLSFFFQAQGLSFEALQSIDSLILQYRNSNGAWVTVWRSPGIPQMAFSHAMVPVVDPLYLHGTFQFRWINYQHYLGNLKQWHLDYVYLNQGRSINNITYEDQAVIYLPDFAFTPYSYIPWKQLQKNFNKYIRADYPVSVSNLSSSGETFSLGLDVQSPSGQVGNEVLNGQSLAPNGISNFTLNPNISLLASVSDSSYVRLTSRISNILGGNDIRVNDSAVRYIELSNFYAYDDGTAESGYGIRNSNGSVAYGFELEEGDSIRAIWIHFTQAEARVNTGITLNVWQSIAPPNTPSANVDVLSYSLDAGRPVYTDSINGFHLFMFDSAIYVSGRFYIGWTQNSSFLLNVGLDRNYKHNGQMVPNPNLFYNIGGSWRNATVPGTIMMRPVMGDMWEIPLQTKRIANDSEVKIYPNPANQSFRIQMEESSEEMAVLDMSGRWVMDLDKHQTEYNVAHLPNGTYLIRIKTNNNIQHHKLIICH